MTRKASLAAGLGLTAALVLVELVRILQVNGGTFVYTLDDPYIHLALADRIATGHYGINAGEASAPSSSVLWPFLLAPFAFLARFDLVPLFLNVLAAGGTVVIAWKILGRLIRVPDPRVAETASSVLLVLFVLAGNVVGLAFTGMEHSLQVLLAALLVHGFVREQETGECAAALSVAAVAGPLIRYESMALSAAALLLLARRGHVRAAARIAAALLALLGGFSLFLLHLGLRPLPTSVLAKSPAVARGGTPDAVWQNAAYNLSGERGRLLAVVLVTVALVTLLLRSRDGSRELAAATAVGVGLHLLLGRNGWFHRYEIYVWVFAILCLLTLVRQPLCAFLSRSRPIPRLAALTAAAAVFAVLTSRPYVTALLQTPLAANNIYGQQFQMHRFVKGFWKRPVAVNDLGWVAYRNDQYVLDLGGLANAEVLAHLWIDRNSRWMDELTRERGVELAMIYKSIYPPLPPRWRPLGELRLSGPFITPLDGTVSFFALSPEAERDGSRLLRDFRRTLPEGVQFVFPDGT